MQFLEYTAVRVKSQANAKRIGSYKTSGISRCFFFFDDSGFSLWWAPREEFCWNSWTTDYWIELDSVERWYKLSFQWCFLAHTALGDRLHGFFCCYCWIAKRFDELAFYFLFNLGEIQLIHMKWGNNKHVQSCLRTGLPGSHTLKWVEREKTEKYPVFFSFQAWTLFSITFYMEKNGQ